LEGRISQSKRQLPPFLTDLTFRSQYLNCPSGWWWRDDPAPLSRLLHLLVLLND
jgi:hypothetical protein